MDPYLEFFLLLALVCMAYAIKHITRRSQEMPTDNPVTQVTAENRTLAYKLAIIRLLTVERRNLARFVLALANTGPYKYGTPGLTNTILNTYPLTNTALRTGVIRMNLVFSARRLIGKGTNNVLAKPPTDNEYTKMVEVLSTDANFLVACVQHSHTLRAALQFLESSDHGIKVLLPESQSLTMRNIEILEGINQELF